MLVLESLQHQTPALIGLSRLDNSDGEDGRVSEPRGETQEVSGTEICSWF